MKTLAPRRLSTVTILSSILLLTAGCESSGGLRFAGVGDTPGAGGGSGTGGSGGGSGAGAGSGGSGSGVGGGTGGSGTGGGGTGGSQTPSGLGALPVGGIVGPDGIANTGILPNVGDPNKQTVLSPILVSAGNAVLGVAGAAGGATGTVPGVTQVTGTVTRVLADTGQALVKTGNGQGYLVDGLAAAVGDAVTISLADKTLTAPASGAPLLGVSVLSPTQAQGSLATAGALTGNQVVNASVNPIGGLPATGALQSTANNLVGAVGNTVNSVAGSVATPSAGAVTGPVGGLLTPVTATVGGALGVGGGVTTPAGSVGGGVGAGAGAAVGNLLGSTTNLLGGK